VAPQYLREIHFGELTLDGTGFRPTTQRAAAIKWKSRSGPTSGALPTHRLASACAREKALTRQRWPRRQGCALRTRDTSWQSPTA
jgi:hypothetical protein